MNDSDPISTMVKIHHSKVTYPPCRPYDYEIGKNGMVDAQPYEDSMGRTRYCCNPHHNHYYSGSGCFTLILFLFGTAVLMVLLILVQI